MKKMPTIFVRDWNGDRSLVTREPHPDCDWVFAGEGVATRKIDGACCMVRDGKLFKRREVKKGQNPPPGFEQVDFDDETGKTVGWVPVGDGPEDKWFVAAFGLLDPKSDGTYEAVGPHFQGNPERISDDCLVSHAMGAESLDEQLPRDFDGLKAYLSVRDIEGVVFQHPDGRMAKIKGRDFGIKRGSRPAKGECAE